MTPHEHLAWLHSRRSIRNFKDQAIEAEVLERVLIAATTAPSASNRQPWRFALVESADVRTQILDLVKHKTETLVKRTEGNRHAGEFRNYSEFFWKALATAPAIIIPQYRTYPDPLVRFLGDAVDDLASLSLPSTMQPERCGTSAAIMALLLQAHAEGLGATWMAGPTVAKKDIESLLDIRSPWQMLGGIALGYPTSVEDSPKQRKDLAFIVKRF